MKKIYLLFSIVVSMSAVAQDWQWMTGIEQGFGGYYDLVSTDAAGNVYTYATISENVTMPGYQVNKTGTGNDIYFVKFNASGEMQWYRHPAGNGTESLWNMDVDASGNIFISGSFTNGISFGTQSFTGLGSFVAKYDTNGNLLWVKRFTLSWHKRLRVDTAGNIYLVGTFNSPLTYGNITLTPATGNGAAFIIKLNPVGDILWGRLADHSSNSFNDVYDVTADSTGNIYMSGTFGTGTLTLGGITLTSPHGSNAYIVKYNSDGTEQWAKRTGDGSCAVSIMSVEPDADGNIFASGTFCGTLDLESTSLTASSGSRLFIAKYTSGGTVLWAKTAMPGGNSSSIRSADLDANGNLIVSGNAKGNVNLGNNVVLNTSFEAKYIAKYSSDGTPQWITGSSETGINNEISVECWGENIIYSAGVIINTPTLTFGDLTYTKTGANLYNIHIGRLLDNALSVPKFDAGSFSVYPNPVADVLNIDTQENVESIVIADLNGRVVASAYQAASIKTENLAKGVYLLTVSVPSGKITRKIIKE